MAVLYGLRTCDTCRKAAKDLENVGKTVAWRDVRENPPDRATLERFLAAFGEALVNHRSTTWRGLAETERSGAPAVLLARHPALMKRPVIESEAGLTMGWDEAARAVHLGECAART